MESLSNARASLRLLRMAGETARSLAALHVSRATTGGCPHEAAREGNAWARRLIRALGVEVTVRGAPLPGPHLLLGNHRSYIDILAMLGVTPCAFLAKAEIARWPLLGAAAQLHPTVFVTRDDRDSRKRAREGALGYLQKGLAFAAFPGGNDLPRPGRAALLPGAVPAGRAVRLPHRAVRARVRGPRGRLGRRRSLRRPLHAHVRQAARAATPLVRPGPARREQRDAAPRRGRLDPRARCARPLARCELAEGNLR